MTDNSSNPRSAAFALAIGWADYMNNTDKVNDCKSEMRKAAIDVICQSGYADDSVYDSLEKSYINNFISNNPDYEEIRKTLNALASINTNKAAGLLLLFLQGLHQKRCADSWGDKEEQIYPWVIESLGRMKHVSKSAWNLLVIIIRTEEYSIKERICARDALIKMKERISKPAA